MTITELTPMKISDLSTADRALLETEIAAYGGIKAATPSIYRFDIKANSGQSLSTYDVDTSTAGTQIQVDVQMKNGSSVIEFDSNSLKLFKFTDDNKLLQFNATSTGTFAEGGVYVDTDSNNKFDTIRITLTDDGEFDFDKSTANTIVDPFFMVAMDTNAPEVKSPYQDVIMSAGEYSFNLPADAIIDIDYDDHLTYSATLESGEKLPEWIDFDPETLTFSGKTTDPEKLGSYYLQMKATDSYGIATNDEFKLMLTYEADANEDGKVNEEDLTLIESSWGEASELGDLNGDGKVGLADLDLLDKNWYEEIDDDQVWG
jgi:hypothetical protein